MTQEARLEMFFNRLLKVYRHRSKWAKREKISCWRLYDKDLPEFPLIIDLYDDKVYVAEYKAKHHLSEEEHEAWLNQSLEVIARVTQVPDERIFLKERKRKANRLDQYRKTGDEQVFFEVEEDGLRFRINLTDYLDTGLFLDHRITRKMFRAEAHYKDVLNLFAYTGSFSVYAAAGGAKSVTTVDLSNTYLSWAKENFSRNGMLNTSQYHFLRADVKQYLETLAPASFDLVIMDPPTFSNSKMMKDILDIQQDHVFLINSVMRSLRADGVLYFSTNYQRFVLQTDAIHAASIKDITRTTTPFDFEGKLKRWCWRMEK